MHQNNFLLSMIVTAKPFIADLVFQPKSILLSSNFMITNYFFKCFDSDEIALASAFKFFKMFTL